MLILKQLTKSILFFLFSFTLFFSARANKFEISEIPEWVVDNHPTINSTFSKYDVNSGVYTSMLDYQVNMKNRADFTHFSLNIVSDPGVSPASEIKIVFDSSYQHVQFHYLYVWRKGKKIDKTAQLSFEMMNNEKDLNFSIYSGLITAYDIIDDVRKEDIVEYAYTIIGDNPIFSNYGYRFFPLEDTNPIDHLAIRIIYPKEIKYNYKCISCGDEDKLQLKEEGEYKVIELVKEHIVAVDVEETVPTWRSPYKHLVLTNFKNWEEVNDWAMDLFKLENIDEQDFSHVFEEIFTEDMNLDQKMDAIINYVQNDIRYLGLESGIGSFKPFPPNKVVEQRYGDCKDKSLLMVTLLKKIGVNASYPALVNSSVQEGIENYLPGGQLFNHCIVNFQHEGKNYWIDPTIPLQGGTYKTKITPDYGKALVIKKGENKLTALKINDEISRTEIFEAFSIPSFKSEGSIIVTSKLYGANADYMRSALEYYSIKDVSTELKNAYGMLFPTIEEADKLKITDDVENNVITTVESYTISDIWKETDELGSKMLTFQYEPIPIYHYVSAMICESKKYTVQVPYPSKIKLSTLIYLPDKIKFPDESEKFNNAAFNFEKKKTLIGNKSISINYEFFTKTKEISKEEFKKACTDSNDLNKQLPMVIYYPK